ncbi:c-type cytochrome [Microvirga sp. M2]|uniref:c-type cytochrome n=1 Tax=Microvirga sp. M2 TaxID=3073270 RepID=UPI0039C34622
MLASSQSPLPQITTMAISAVASLVMTAPVYAQSDGRWRDGEQVYVKVCGYCHETGVGPVLKGRDLPAETFVLMARHGLSAMPAFRASEIDDQTLQALGEYLAKAPAPKADGGKP